MARVQRPRVVDACAVLLGAIIHVFGEGRARAANPDIAGSDVGVGALPGSGCPDSAAVWSTVLRLVPSEETQLLAAKPRVEIVDLGERYRVRVAIAEGALERVYADPARECEKRTRFAAEFIVVSLLPPQLGIVPDTTGAATRAVVPASPKSTLPAAASAPAARSATGSSPSRSAILRIELSGISEAAPPLGAPAVLMWGAALRVGLGTGRIAGIAGIAYLPSADFDVGDFTGNVTRVPATLGVRARVVKKNYGQLDGDLALSAAFERYEGVSPHAPSDATRVTPGLELGIVASPRAAFGLAPIASVRCAWFPLTRELASAPQGNLGSTPSFWIGFELGMSLEL